MAINERSMSAAGVRYQMPAVQPEAVDFWSAVENEEWGEAEQSESNWEGSGRWIPTGFLEWFAVSQTALPALLYLPGSQAFRFPIRVAAFAVSLIAFVIWWFDRGGSRPLRHPADRWLALALLCLVVMIPHPETASLFAGMAQTLLYFAVFAPLFWVPAFVTNRHQVIRILVIFLICNGINSIVGVLQVYDPNRWLPAEFSSTFALNQNMLAGSTFIGPNGVRIVRPPGLFDTPGAVCGAGTFAALLGLIFCLESNALWKRGAALGLSGLGIAAIYLSHVRASLVVVVGMMCAYVGMLALQNQKKRVAAFVTLAVALVVFGFTLATMLGGDSIQGKFSSLLEDDPRELYYQSRGQQLQYAFSNLIVDYPLGAGLARWGMMRGYFEVPESKAIWAEIQPSAWILDGGLFLLVFYGLALVATGVYELRLIMRLTDPTDRLWASALAAANIGTLALVFSFVPFTTQVGLQFWFLEGLLFGAIGSRFDSR